MGTNKREFAALIERLREGSEDAAWELVERYGSHILRVVRRTIPRGIRSKFDSQDFVQAVWSSFFFHRSRLLQTETPEQMMALLAAMAKHKIIDETRKRMATQRYDVRRERPLSGSTARPNEELTSREPTPSQVAMAREQWKRLLQDQPKHYQTIVRLRLSGETYGSIAQKLNVSQRTVQRVLVRLLEKKIA